MRPMTTPGPVELVIILLIFAMVVVVPIALILAVVRRGRGAIEPGTVPADPALDVLRTRLANEDIDEIEFERLRSVLQRR